MCVAGNAREPADPDFPGADRAAGHCYRERICYARVTRRPYRGDCHGDNRDTRGDCHNRRHCCANCRPDCD